LAALITETKLDFPALGKPTSATSAKDFNSSFTSLISPGSPKRENPGAFLLLEDKAAFINKVEKVGVTIDSFDIKDNKLDDTFEFSVEDPGTIEVINTILRQSPKINQIKEQLKAMIREELKAFRNKE
jgi:hypothetical protein